MPPGQGRAGSRGGDRAAGRWQTLATRLPHGLRGAFPQRHPGPWMTAACPDDPPLPGDMTGVPHPCPSGSPATRAPLTRGREQQGAVLAVEVLHGGDPRVPGVSVVEVIQLLPLLPVPETEGNERSEAGRPRGAPLAPTGMAMPGVCVLGGRGEADAPRADGGGGLRGPQE